MTIEGRCLTTIPLEAVSLYSAHFTRRLLVPTRTAEGFHSVSLSVYLGSALPFLLYVTARHRLFIVDNDDHKRSARWGTLLRLAASMRRRPPLCLRAMR